ncbi:hypothetical protein SLEP1_g47052 [Rubroshorea leprosula]|uniref:Uncharacterized protein n=1 Tax=Rubroshorea leprosula TaxID=152421 RepID=A0AAV5LRS2_9ROSI|nr:hypothetical protein SLEP1_g47052 [Rubroshorea leprosula]
MIPLPHDRIDHMANANSSSEPTSSQSSQVVDLSGCIPGTQVNVPTLNVQLVDLIFLFTLPFMPSSTS